MSNKVVIFDGKKLYAWFEEGTIWGSVDKAELFVVGEKPMSSGQLNNLSRFNMLTDISIKLNGGFFADFGGCRPTSVFVDYSSGVVTREKFGYSTRENIVLHADGRIQEHTTVRRQNLKNPLKVDYKQFNDRNPDVKLKVMSTLDEYQHGFVTAVANSVSPAQAIKRLIKTFARDGFHVNPANAKENEDRLWNKEVIHEIWYENDEIQIMTYTCGGNSKLNFRPLTNVDRERLNLKF